MPDAVSGEIHTRTHAHIRASLSFSFPRISSFPTYDYLTSFRDRYSPLHGTTETIKDKQAWILLPFPPILFEFCALCSVSSSDPFEDFRSLWFFLEFFVTGSRFNLNLKFRLNFFLFDRLEVFKFHLGSLLSYFLFDL